MWAMSLVSFSCHLPEGSVCSQRVEKNVWRCLRSAPGDMEGNPPGRGAAMRQER